jgi:transposase
MAYREVTMVEIKEVLRLWKAGIKKKRIAAQATVDVKTVRRYIGAAEDCGLVPGPEPPLDDEQVAVVVAALAPETGRPHGDSWQQCEVERDAIAKLLADGVRLSKVRRLLHRRGVDVPYPTLHRFAVAELGFCQRAPTMLDVELLTLGERCDDGGLRAVEGNALDDVAIANGASA